MSFRLALPTALLVGVGVGLFLFLRHEDGGEAFLFAVFSGLLAGAGVVLTAASFFGRLRALAQSARDAAQTPSLGAEGDGVGDAVESLDLSFERLTARSTEQLSRLTSEARTLLAVLDGMNDGIWVTDAGGTLVQHNAALTRILSWGETLVGQRPLSLVRDTDLHDAVLAACERGETRTVEVTLQGTAPRVYSVQVTPLARDLPGSAAVFHDVTDLRRLESIRKDFVANVSHELRTPITAIRGYAETLLGGALSSPEHASRMMEIIHRQSERLSVLLDDLLEISRLEAQARPLARDAIVLADVATRALEAVGPKAERQGLTLTADVADGLQGMGDARALEQVLLNLLDNAIKFTPGGGRIELRAFEAADGKCRLEVQDTGPGIEARHLPRIFERFYRVDSGRSREQGGAGLGLSIVKHLVGGMGGDIGVESELGKGSLFWVLLPKPPTRSSANHPTSG